MPGGLDPPSIQLEEETRKESGRKVVFVLEQANLEVAKVGKVLFLLQKLSQQSQRSLLPKLHSPSGTLLSIIIFCRDINY